MRRKSQRIYLDYAASTPVDPRVLRAMRPYFAEKFGNPGSLHSFGQEAIAAVDGARETLARALGRPAGEGFREIIFTGSATEANNIALRGALKAWKRNVIPAQAGIQVMLDPGQSRGTSGMAQGRRPRIIVSAIEHESILETARDLERDGVEVVYLPVDKNGRVSLSALKKALTPETVLVSVMYGNNEIGVIQPIAEISEIIRNFREQEGERRFFAGAQNDVLDSRIRGNDTKTRRAYWKLEIGNWKFGAYPLLHTDAAQCLAYLPCDPDELGVDLMTLSAHKIYGPKGVGALWARRQSAKRKAQSANRSGDSRFALSDLLIAPVITGGNQEFGLRSATENVPSIVGFAKAVELTVAEREKNYKYVSRLRAEFLKGLRKIVPALKVNGGNPVLPHILSVRLPGVAAADLLTALDRRGVAVSSGSACRARSFEPSYVLTAIGGEKLARESIRVGFGRPTTMAEVHQALKVFRGILKDNI